MRCYCCNKNLSDKESTLKSATTGQYLDMCIPCLVTAGIIFTNKNDNLSDVSPDEDVEDFDYPEDE